jgi:hypothetical protein
MLGDEQLEQMAASAGGGQVPPEDMAAFKRAHYEALRHGKSLLTGEGQGQGSIAPQSLATLTEDMFRANTKEIVDKLKLPNCSECYGCTTSLTNMHSEVCVLLGVMHAVGVGLQPCNTQYGLEWMSQHTIRRQP